jgi:hypothetical protein
VTVRQARACRTESRIVAAQPPNGEEPGLGTMRTGIRRALAALGVVAAIATSAAAPTAAGPVSSTPTVTFTMLTPLPTELASGWFTVLGGRRDNDGPCIQSAADALRGRPAGHPHEFGTSAARGNAPQLSAS